MASTDSPTNQPITEFSEKDQLDTKKKPIEEQAKEKNVSKHKTVAQQRCERKEILKKLEEKPQVFVKKTIDQKRQDREKRNNCGQQSVKNSLLDECEKITNNQRNQYKKDHDTTFVRTDDREQLKNVNPFDVLRKKR